MGDLDFFSILIFIAAGFAASAITALAGLPSELSRRGRGFTFSRLRKRRR